MFWYEDEISYLEHKAVAPKTEKKRVLFYGSSSIRLWNSLNEYFPEFDVVNQGFGGSTLAACCWFFKRVVPQFHPDVIVLYAGDNDLGDGRHPQEVYLNVINILQQIKEHCGDIPVAVISIKTSPSRLHLYGSIEYTNCIVKEEISTNYPNVFYVEVNDAMRKNNSIDHSMYEPDGLHLSSNGYRVWARELRAQFFEKINDKVVSSREGEVNSIK